jgi:hypothetical protein
MFYHFNVRVFIVSLLQLGLLVGFYSNPVTRQLSSSVYGALLAATSSLLLLLSYQAFQRLQLVVAVVATLLAFPGLLLSVMALAFWMKSF